MTKIYKLLSSSKQPLFAFVLILFWGTAYAQTTYTFNYTGTVQTINLSAGTYSIECWGADGGDGYNGTNLNPGGKGGYSRGVFTNNATAAFNVYVGGRGGNASVSGGNVGGGGGGMSDIALASNTSAVIIAAGGAGGSTSGVTTNENSTGGGGGGLTGGTAIDGSGVTGGSAATGGSQSAGGFATAGTYGVGGAGGYGYGGGGANGGADGVMHGAGGVGGSGGSGGWNGGGGGGTLTTSSNINDHAAGGGAGYYGGGGGRGDGGAGGGGSSYIGGLSSAATFSFGQTGFVTNPDVTGNGRVLITELCSIKLTTSSSGTVTPAILCAGNSLTITSDAISNYSWSTGAITSSIVVAPTTNTVYSLTAMSPSNCMTTAIMSVIVSSGVPALTLAATPASVCIGDSVKLNATGAITYTWSNGVNNNQLFPPAQTTTYVVTGKNGCGTSTAAITVTALPLPVSITGATNTICSGSPLSLTVTGATNYTWSTSQTSTVITVAPTSPTTYSVFGKKGNCFNTNTYSVNINPLPNVQLVGTSIAVCYGNSVTLTASGGNNYTWTPNTFSGTTITDTPTTSVNYQLLGSNSFGCINGANHVVIVNPLPTITVNSSQPIICPGATVALTAAGGHTYSWSTGAQTKTVSVYPTSTTQYTVTGTFTTTGCQDDAYFTVNVDQPTLSVSASQTVCPGALVSMTVSGSNPNWSNGSTNPFNAVTVTSPTMYTVSAKVLTANNLLCDASATITLGMNPQPVVVATATRSEICRNEKTVLTASGANTYLWMNNNQTGNTQTFSNNVPSTYIIKVEGTDANGCKDTAQVSVKVNACLGLAEGRLSSVSVFPNPSSGKFTVKSENNTTLQVVNELGQLLRIVELNEQNQREVQISDLPKSIYFILGDTGNEKIKHKLIVE